jgi:hypothetical protein
MTPVLDNEFKSSYSVHFTTSSNGIIIHVDAKPWLSKFEDRLVDAELPSWTTDFIARNEYKNPVRTYTKKKAIRGKK